MKIDSHALGTYFSNNLVHGLLGNRHSNIDSLRTHFPTVNFKRIKQVHGDKSVHTSPHSIDFANEADAHYTSEKNLAMCINTADCIPVFFFHQEPRWVLGIHAGWRGVEKRIVPKALQILKKQGCDPKHIFGIVGPHIQKNSFEAGNDVRDLLLKSVQNTQKSMFFEEKRDGKSLVDLNLILKEQLLESQIDLEKVSFEFKDTVTNLDYHSFRRDKENSGRQLSWIALR